MQSRRGQRCRPQLTSLEVRTLMNADLPAAAADALKKAVDYYHSDISAGGGYLWKYSDDLSGRDGEKAATADQIWVQNPGTPGVGMAFLDAYKATGDPVYLADAVDAAHALVGGQLRSGGWRYSIELDPVRRKAYDYRVDPEPAKLGPLSNLSTLDDDTTTSALRLLMYVDQATGFKDRAIHEAASYGLAGLVAAQYPNGAWPQRFDGPTPQDTSKYPTIKASFPGSYPTTDPYPDDTGQGTFGSFYTLNDNVMVNTIDLFLQAANVYNHPSYLSIASKGANFLVLAQMPGPQPIWAQQYDFQMHPAWARGFEPPAVDAYASQFVINELMKVYHATGNAKFLAPIPKALAYLQSSTLPDDQLARFYEPQTSRPLYVTPGRQLTHSDASLLAGYFWKVPSQVAALTRSYQRALATGPVKPTATKPKDTPALEAQVAQVIGSLNDAGQWLTQGNLASDAKGSRTRPIVDSQAFIANVDALAQYLTSLS